MFLQETRNWIASLIRIVVLGVEEETAHAWIVPGGLSSLASSRIGTVKVVWNIGNESLEY